MSHRRLRLAALAAVALALTACAPQSAPEPTPTGFASEDEAYAAAEETYRAYVDALNQRFTVDPPSKTHLEFLTGEALEADTDTQAYLEENGIRVEGATAVRSFSPVSFAHIDEAAEVVANVCLDDSSTRLLNSKGEDVTPNQEPLFGLTVTFASAGSHLAIAESDLNGDLRC